MCDSWRLAADRRYAQEKELTTDEWKQVIDDFARLGTPVIVFTGGEPLLRTDLFELIAYAKQKGLSVQLSTNGFLLDIEKARRLFDLRLDLVNISLDGVKPDTHDRIRGHQHSYERAVEAIKNISLLNEKSGHRIVLMVTCVISKLNLEEILDLVPFVIKLGACGISFMPATDILLQFDKQLRAREFLVDDLDRAGAIVAGLIRIKKKTGWIDCSAKYLRLLNQAFASRRRPVRCYAGYASCSVDPYGKVYPCFPSSEDASTAANIRYSSLNDVWHSGRFNKTRGFLRNCRSCYWNCWTELSIVFDPF